MYKRQLYEEFWLKYVHYLLARSEDQAKEVLTRATVHLPEKYVCYVTCVCVYMCMRAHVVCVCGRVGVCLCGCMARAL